MERLVAVRLSARGALEECPVQRQQFARLLAFKARCPGRVARSVQATE